MASYAADVASICAALALEKPILVGHSMGGSIVLELAAHYPEIPGSLILIDSVLFPPQALIDASALLIAALEKPDFSAAYRSGISRLHLPTDEISEHDDVFEFLPRAPQHVLVLSFIDQLIGHDIGRLHPAVRCRLHTSAPHDRWRIWPVSKA
jgi:pimeloyl-ACP methyl ester carboxylesterase